MLEIGGEGISYEIVTELNKVRTCKHIYVGIYIIKCVSLTKKCAKKIPINDTRFRRVAKIFNTT